ncbi:MAG: hypothetical protein JO072_03585 [Parafilimonas sp.]|nr:hypothetical protein [Parafilimonas sp.]
MKQIILSRITDDGKQTLGTLSFQQDNEQIFLCKTLELPWLNNHSQTSCIPAGTYTCKYTRSERFSTSAGHDVFTYEVEDVPNRGGIRIHSANFFSDLLGCIALGGAFKDLNLDGEPDVVDSRNTVHAFENQLQHEPFILVIHEIPVS